MERRWSACNTPRIGRAWHKSDCPIAHRDEHIRRVFETGRMEIINCTCDIVAEKEGGA